MTFTLISTVYACGIAKPGHGSMTPIAVGFSLIACAGAGAKYTGAALNPARVLGERWLTVVINLMTALEGQAHPHSWLEGRRIRATACAQT